MLPARELAYLSNLQEMVEMLDAYPVTTVSLLQRVVVVYLSETLCDCGDSIAMGVYNSYSYPLVLTSSYF